MVVDTVGKLACMPTKNTNTSNSSTAYKCVDDALVWFCLSVILWKSDRQQKHKCEFFIQPKIACVSCVFFKAKSEVQGNDLLPCCFFTTTITQTKQIFSSPSKKSLSFRRSHFFLSFFLIKTNGTPSFFAYSRMASNYQYRGNRPAYSRNNNSRSSHGHHDDGETDPAFEAKYADYKRFVVHCKKARYDVYIGRPDPV